MLPRFLLRFLPPACLLAASLAAAAPSASTSGTPAPGQTVQSFTGQSYTVQPGDTAYSLARRFGLDLDTLLTANHLNAAALAVGQTLLLPAPPAPRTAAPRTAAPRTGGPASHTVQPGQTLYAIARLYGCTPTELQALNRLDSPDLKPGQVLQLPAAGQVPQGQASSAARPAPAPPVPTSAVSPPASRTPPGQTPISHTPTSQTPTSQTPASQTPARIPQPSVPGEGPLPTSAQSIVPVLSSRLPASASRPAPAQATPPAPATSYTVYTVQPGQTLYGIARQYGLKPAELLTLNRLDSPDLLPGQQLRLPTGGGASSVPPTVSPQVPLPQTAVPQTAVLQPPKLSVLSVGVPLPSTPVASTPGAGAAPPGIPLGASIPPAAEVAVPADLLPTPPQSADWRSLLDWRSLALSFVGVPYRYGGSSRSGTDCSGLVIQVFGPLGLKLPRQSAMQAQVGQPVAYAALTAGDLVFFDTAGGGSVTHVGIYLGDGAFINANSYNGEVAINQLSEKYFAQRYLGARRILGVLAQGN